jgi:hypothetical protein
MPDGSAPVCFYNYEITPQLQHLQELYEPLGGDSPVLISQFLRGYEGEAKGIIDHDGAGPGHAVTGKVMRDYIKYYRSRPGIKAILLYADEALDVCIYDITYKGRVKAGGKIVYDVSFSFFQNGIS